MSALRVLEINQVRIVAIVEVIDTKHPFTGHPSTFDFLRPRSADVQVMIVGRTVSVTLSMNTITAAISLFLFAIII